MRYKKIPFKQASDEIIKHELKDINASGMFRAYAKEGEKGKVLIFKN